MNDKIHEELTLLEKELNRLDTAVKDIETAKEISSSVVRQVSDLTNQFKIFFEKLDTSFSEIIDHNKKIIQEQNNSLNKKIFEIIQSFEKEAGTASDSFKSSLSETKNELDSIIIKIEDLIIKGNVVNENMNKVSNEIIELHLPFKFDKLDATISSISQGIQNIQGRLDSLESNIIRETNNQKKEISDEMELVTLGMNNINHKVDEKFTTSTEQFYQLKKENKILFILIGILIIISIVKFFI